MVVSERSGDRRTASGVIPFEGTEFFYTSVGTGRRVVLLHGGPGLGSGYLRPTMDTLAESFEVVYVDQRGSGKTPVGHASRLNLAAAVDDLRGVLDGLGIARANLVGHSYGADLAALFAAALPGRVGSLVIANPGPPFEPEEMEALGDAMQRRRSARDAAALNEVQRSPAFDRREPVAVEEYIRILYLPFFDNPAVGRSVSYDLSEHSAATVVEAEEAFFGDVEYTHEALAMLQQVTAPTLVLYAERDPIPESFARRLADRIPGARYQYLSRANHFAYLEHPEVFFGAVIPFLDASAV